MRQCAICGKGSQLERHRNKLRGQYNPTPKVRKYPNLQKTTHEGEKVLACTKCIKKANKEAK